MQANNKSIKATGFGGLGIANAFSSTNIFSKTSFTNSRNALGDIGNKITISQQIVVSLNPPQ